MFAHQMTAGGNLETMLSAFDDVRRRVISAVVGYRPGRRSVRVRSAMTADARRLWVPTQAAESRAGSVLGGPPDDRADGVLAIASASTCTTRHFDRAPAGLRPRVQRTRKPDIALASSCVSSRGTSRTRSHYSSRAFPGGALSAGSRWVPTHPRPAFPDALRTPRLSGIGRRSRMRPVSRTCFRGRRHRTACDAHGK